MVKENSKYNDSFIVEIYQKLKLMNNKELKFLKEFKDLFLFKDTKYIILLIEYKTLSSIIIKHLMAEKSLDFHLFIYMHYIRNCITDLKQGNINQAINKYIDMMEFIKEKYNIENITIDLSHLSLNTIRTDELNDEYVEVLCKKLIVPKNK